MGKQESASKSSPAMTGETGSKQSADEAYEKAIASAYEAYKKARAPAYEAYKKAIAQEK